MDDCWLFEVSFSPDGKYLAIASEKKCVKLISVV